MPDKWEIKLYKEQHKKNFYKYTTIILTILIFIISITFFTYSKLVSKNTIDLVSSTVSDFKAYDLLFAAYINDEESYEFPSKDDGYVLDEDKSYCDNGALEWDNSTWKPTISGTTKRTKCYLYFVEGNSTGGSGSTETGNAKEFITNLLSTSTEVIEDETDDKNVRYIGADPNNYIWFNCDDYSNPTEDTCERWRIIGVMNNVSTDNGTESLVKIVRASFIGTYAWDRTETSYSNVWDTSTIKSLLNDTYYNNGTSTQYYGSTVSTKTAAFDGTGDTKGITSATKNLIQEVNWNVTSAASQSTALTMYNRTGTTSKINIGLIDSADYGFATSGGDTGRSTCLGVNLYDWDATAQTDCRTNSWLWYSNPTSTNLLGTKSYYWTIRPYSGNSGYALGVYSYGYVGNSNAYNDLGVRPALFLKSSVLIQDASGEDGSYNSPYVIRTSA